jgi:putative transcriptional regulator
MGTKSKKQSRVTEAILETAADMHKSGIMADVDYAKITMRHLGKDLTAKVEPVSADEIKSLRERAHMSQAVFARQLGVTTGYVSKLECGAKQPTGPALVLLNVIRRKGIEAIL